MPRKGDNIYKRKDGRWEGRYVKGRKNGRTSFGSVFGKTYQETRTKLAKARCDWNEGLAMTKKERTKLKAVSECWLRESEAFLKESTIAIYRNYLHKHIYPVFANTKMADISNETLSDFCVALLENGKTNGQGLSPKTVAEVFRVMKQIRKFAMLRSMAVGYSADCVHVKQKVKPPRVFSQTERDMLHAHLDGSEDRSRLGIWLCLSTGLRLGEVCALTWDDISLEEQELYVRHTILRIPNEGDDGAKTKVVITSPKSQCSLRTIPLTDKICSALAPKWQPGAYFLTGDTEKYMEPRTMQNHFKAVLAAAGIEDANFHTLRHTFATQCVEAEMDVKCLSEILGHSSVNITMDRYVHPTMEWKRQNIEKMASLML